MHRCSPILVVCAGTLTGLDRALTDTAVPYIPAVPAALIVAAVAALTLGTVMIAQGVRRVRSE